MHRPVGDAGDPVPAAGDPAVGDDVQLLPDRLCQAVVELLAVDGAGISVYLGADIAVPVGASDVGAATGEALQFTLREGPCFEAYATEDPVLIPDLDRHDSHAWAEWPIYADELTRRTPYRAVFAYPLLAGDVVLGSLGLYRRSPGVPDGLHDVRSVAAHVTDRLLKADFVTDEDEEPAPSWLDSPSGLRRRQVWLAQGLVVQANLITPGQAIDLLRAQAFTADRLVDDLAADILSGRSPIPVLESGG